MGLPIINKPPFFQAISTVTNVMARDTIIMNTLIVNNLTASQAYLQIFNLESPSVVVGTTAPYVTLPLPPSGGVTVDGRWKIGLPTSGCSLVGTTTATGSTVASVYVVAFYE